MLPTRLEMRNFLAYRAPAPIVFEGIELACLTGQNGVGKSSILDAITWALWGTARAKRDEELIHLGQAEMQVQLDFEQDGIRYRVIRRRARAGRGSRGGLDLMVWGTNETPRIISEGGIRRTQDKLNDILGLEFDTFVHSAFLQQGKADAFTLKTAAERKRLLSDILGLDQWTGYEDKAKKRLAALTSQIEIVTHDISQIDDEIAREPQLQAEHDELTASLESAQASLDQASERYDQVANSAAALHRERASKTEIERLIDSRRADIDLAQAEIARQDQKIAEYHRTIEKGETIKAGYQQLIEARESQSAIAEQLAQRQEVDRQRHLLEQALADQRAQLKREADVIRERINGLQKSLSAAAATDTEALQTKIRSLEALDAQRNATTKLNQKLNIQRSGIAARLDSIRVEGSAINERLDRLQVADGATCPLCGQALTATHRDETLAQLEAERDAMREQYRSFSGEIREIDERRKSQERELEGWALQLKDLPALQRQLGAATEQSRNAEEAESLLHTETTRLSQVEARLTNDDYAHELRQQLADLDQPITSDSASHTNIKAQLDSYATYDRQHSQLEFAKISLPEAQKSRAATAQRLAKLHRTLADDEAKLERIIDEIETLDGKLEQEREFRLEVERIRGDVQSLRERKAICNQELNAIAAGRDSKKRLSLRLSATQEQQRLVNELRTSFGKDGVPAMIIETVIPELETEANDLLARMTDGRMTLRFSTQRERVTGSLAETLDIVIADELGTRAYELYSGGEAFRINFAIRIALSKMLTRRAGAQLRTLFIDEGFGSQDEDGRDKLVDAINKIKSDFDLILVITHIDELRDAFPLHLLVEKTAAGSKVTMR